MPHNGGRSQVNFNFLDGDHAAFLNLMKPCGPWTYPDNEGAPAPDTLDANGYPIAISHFGVYMQVRHPTQAERPGRYAVTWDSVGTTTIIVGGFPISGITGSLTTSAATGRYEFFPESDAVFQIGIATVGVSNMKVFHVDDEALINQGKIFGQKFLEVLKKAHFGVLRFLNWQNANMSNVTTWATRRPVDYVFYAGDEYRSEMYATPASSPMTNVGQDYAITFGSGGPVDKQTLHINVNASPTIVSATVTYTSGSSGTVNAVAHPFSNGDPVGIGSTSSEPPLIFRGMNYYVVNATANTFQLAITFGGSAVAIGTGGAGTQIVYRQCTLNLNATGAIPIRTFDGDPIANADSFSPTAFGFTGYGTITYDVDINAWLLIGCSTIARVGLNNGVPIDIMIQLAIERSAHPWFPSPRFTVDPMTDWHTELATYCKENCPSWMIPRFESVNEVNFNGSAGFSTRYGWNKAFVHWGLQFNAIAWQGKCGSTLGQAINAVYDGPVDGTKYWAISGIQTAGFFSALNASASDQVFTSAAYVGQAAPAQSGYVKEPASNWLTHVCGANYFSPTVYNTGTETTLAAAYAGGDVTAPTTYANYSNAVYAGNGFPLERLRTFWSFLYPWAQSFTNRSGYQIRMTAYEGGYSPDIGVGESADVQNLRKASKRVADIGVMIGGGQLSNETTINGSYQDFIDAGGEFPSCFEFNGASIWSIQDPNIYTTSNEPQFDAIGFFNGRFFRVSLTATE